MKRAPEFVTTDEDYRGLEIWLVYGALLHESNGAQKCNYPIPYGKLDHAQRAFIDEVSRRFGRRGEEFKGL